MNKEELIAAGYKPFKQKGIRDYTEQFYQKCIRDENGKKYYITIAEYDNREHKERIPSLPDFSYEPEVQFNSHGTTFNTHMLHHSESVEEMEKFFDRLWFNMDCDYYERYE